MTEYHREGWRDAWALASGVALVAGAAWLLYAVGPRSLDPGQNDPRAEVVRLVAVLAIGFFGLCIVVALAMMRRRGPALVIDDEGIIDHTTGASLGRIPWAEMEEIDAAEEWVLIGVRDLDALARDLPPFRRWLARLDGPRTRVLARAVGLQAAALAWAIREARRRWAASR